MIATLLVGVCTDWLLGSLGRVPSNWWSEYWFTAGTGENARDSTYCRLDVDRRAQWRTTPNRAIEILIVCITGALVHLSCNLQDCSAGLVALLLVVADQSWCCSTAASNVNRSSWSSSHSYSWSWSWSESCSFVCGLWTRNYMGSENKYLLFDPWFLQLKYRFPTHRLNDDHAVDTLKHLPYENTRAWIIIMFDVSKSMPYCFCICCCIESMCFNINIVILILACHA